MKVIIPLIITLILTPLIAEDAANDVPQEEHTKKIMHYASSNFTSSILNVAMQSDEKKIIIYATTSGEPQITTVDEYNITVIVSNDLINNHEKWTGTYHNHHNGQVLCYVSSISDKNPNLYTAIIKLFTQYTPDFEWSSPGRNLTINELAKIEIDQDTYFKDQKRQWHWKYNKYRKSIGEPPLDLKTGNSVIPGHLLESVEQITPNKVPNGSR
jgi:hypothetical protein